MSTVSSDKLSGNVARLVDRLSKDLSNKDLPTTTAKNEVQLRRGPATNNAISKTALVRYSYQAQQEDELNLAEGDLIEVIEEVEDGWMRGKLNDHVGLFPTNFVKFNSQTNNNTATTYSSSTLSRINEKVNDENNDVNPAEKVEKASNILPSAFKSNRRIMSTIVSSNEISHSASNSDVSKPKEFAKVLYAYTASHQDELSLPEGAIITVLNKSCEDDGWFEGELNGKRGLFPENFVKLLPATMESKPSPPLTVPPSLPEKPTKPKATIGQHVMSASGPVPSIENERKSMVADLQNRLFQHGFPSKPLPMKQQTAMNAAGSEAPIHRSIDKSASETESDKLNCPTRDRPKQANKRPPSNMRQIAKKESDDEFPAKESTTSKETTRFDAIPQSVSSIAPVVTKIEQTSTTAKPILIPQNVVQKSKTNIVQQQISALPTTTTGLNTSGESEFVSRADYNALLHRVDRLEKLVEEMNKKLGK